MSTLFSKPSEFVGGTFFKPLDHMNDIALLIEPVRVDRDVPNNYQGRTTNRDEVTAHVTVFGSQGALDSGAPTAVMKNAKVVHGMLTSTLERIIGGAMVATITKTPTKNGSGYVFRDVTGEVEGKVATYFTARDQAAAAAPSFDD